MSRLVVFDLDGVLINSEEANYRAFAYGLGKVGCPTPPKEEVVSLIGLTAEQMLVRLGCPEAAWQAAFEEHVKPYYIRHLPELARPVEGAPEVLAELVRRGYRIGACTSGDLVTQDEALKAIGLREFFEAIQTPCRSRFTKPDPRFLEELVQIFEPSSVHHVEDSEVGLRMGLDFGATTIFADYGYGRLNGGLSPHHRIQRLPELLELL